MSATRVFFCLTLVCLLLGALVAMPGCSDGGDDDDSEGDDDECIVCTSTGECTDALGAGWVCLGGCCEQVGDDDATDDDAATDDDTTDDDAADDDATDDDTTDDDDDDDDASPGDISFASHESMGPVAGGNRQMDLAVVDGVVHAAYTGCSDASCVRSELLYATKETGGGEWDLTSVDAVGGDTGWFPSLAISGAGDIHISYGNHGDGSQWLQRLKYAFKPAGGAWSTAIIGDGWGGFWTSLGLVGQTPVVSNTQLSGSFEGSLQVGSKSGDSWTFETVDAIGDGGWFTSLAITPDNRPVVNYVVGYPAGKAKLAEYDGGEWTLLQFDEGSYGGELAIDADGYFHVVYPKGDSVNGDLWDLWYATNAPAGEWSKLLLDPGANADDDTGGFPSIAIDADGGLHVFYKNFSSASLRYARKIGDAWEFALADAIGGGAYSAVAIDDLGGVHVVYENGTDALYQYCETCAMYD